MDTKLVRAGELQQYLAETLSKQAEIVEDCEKILPHIRDATIRKSIEKRKDEAKNLIEALEKGYIPVQDTIGLHRVDTKSKWSLRAVKETLASMPEEVKVVWEKVKAEGFFDSFSVTVRGGDPILAGNKGSGKYFIAGWLPIAQGYSIGFTIRK